MQRYQTKPPRPLRPLRPLRPRRRPIPALLTFLVVTALVSSWAASIIVAESADANSVIDFEARPFLYYEAHGLAIFAAMAAGVVAMLKGRFRLLRGSVRAAFLVLFAVAIVWALVAYDQEELLSRVVFGATGPFVWLTLIFVVAGSDRRLWTAIDPVIHALAYATCILVFWNLLRTGSSVYVLGYTKHTMYCILLMWLGGWTLLGAVRQQGWRLALSVTPLILLILTAIQSQARSWILLGFLLGSVFLFLRRRDQGSVLSGIRDVILACLFVIAVGVIASHYMTDAVEGVSGRLAEDTRTLQYRDFFSVVPVSDLVLGRGPEGTWYWYGIGEYQYFDNALLWMLFIGGIPTLLCYLIIVVLPALRALRADPAGSDAAAVVLVLFWGLALTGVSTYTMPSVWFSSYLISLWAGRCHLILAETARERKLARIQRLQAAAAYWEAPATASEAAQ